MEEPGSGNAQQGWQSLLGLLLQPLPSLTLQRPTTQTPLRSCSRQVRQGGLVHKAQGTARATGATAVQCPKICSKQLAVQGRQGLSTGRTTALAWPSEWNRDASASSVAEGSLISCSCTTA